MFLVTCADADLEEEEFTPAAVEPVVRVEDPLHATSSPSCNEQQPSTSGLQRSAADPETFRHHQPSASMPILETEDET